MSSSEDHQRLMIKAAWLRWVGLWVPIMLVILTASIWIDFNLIMAGLIAILVGVLLYQRLVNKRSWRSIMWGVHAREE